MSEPPSLPKSASKPRSTPRPISNMQIVFGAILAISLLLAINFSGRIAAGRQISAQRQELLYSIETLQARATALRTELDFYSSDAFIEEWARREGKMIKAGEVLVVPVPPLTTPTPVRTPTPLPAIVARGQSAPSNFELWWQLFFDSPPPR
ncbi:MAG: hypothetical protein CUN49_01060 [Candidatus Thermofonsia Clade 1 bacterium]|jgi:cell division protein FtsB|uniref:Septum formation initiator n=1 Tax=Candidatus Thermofonsia Clade 1 bacterium TaxID=2364210 RepID=A0A2M8PI96_9CHLR|nr:MAG: hypothetical protein CUN49_01060 [Candidatus Thermofonsia Clade 1 bacterium]RMF53175.1 MAG: hypothetical protein D6749_03020 [Chloroflexota bacterium]